MRIDIIHKGKALRRIAHDGEVYVKVPKPKKRKGKKKYGSYSLRVYNHCNKRRLAVITVDGVNVISGKDGNWEGEGYVLDPWETMEIPGWRRGDDTVAAFTFKPEDKSYANATGRGVANVGVIGCAVFDEKQIPKARTIIRHIHHGPYWPYTYPWWRPTTLCDTVTEEEYDSGGGTLTTGAVEVSSGATFTTTDATFDDEPANVFMTMASTGGGTRSAALCLNDATPQNAAPVDVGTGYGQEMSFHTTDTTFNRSSDNPCEVVTLRYATAHRLKTWGIPLDRPEPKRPSAFPKSRGASVPAPPGWSG